MKHDSVSIIITTKNEAPYVGDLFNSIQKQSYPGIEIILVDNHSTDQTLEIGKKYTKNVFTKGPERSAQRNYGAAKAKGNYLFFLDADMVLEPDVVEKCVLSMHSKQAGAVIVPEISFGTTFWARVKAYERSFYIGDDGIEAARFFRKSVFQSLGGFDEEITGPEDWELSDRVRVQYGISRVTSHILHNEATLGFFELLKKKYYYGKKTPVYLSKTRKGTMFSAKTLFFLRKSFYAKPRQILTHPILFCAMIVMLTSELFAGVLGIIAGSFND